MCEKELEKHILQMYAKFLIYNQKQKPSFTKNKTNKK